MSDAERDPASRKRRSDFEHNRDVILKAANAAFSELGMGAPIDAISKRAGVGSATVYRHFPNRVALIEAVFELRAAEYVDAIETAQEHADPTQAFRQTIHTIVALQLKDRSFREILSARDVHPENDPVLVKFGAAILGALEDARSAGVLRSDVKDADVMLLLLATESVARPAGTHSEEALYRLVDLALDGFCNQKSELHGEPLDFDQVLDVARS